MAQLSNINRKTKVIRVPRKYEYLTKAFAIWLSNHPNQAELWDCEEYLQTQHEEGKHRKGSLPWKRNLSKSTEIVLAQLQGN